MSLLKIENCEAKVKALMNSCKTVTPKMLQTIFSDICASLSEVGEEESLENIQAELIARIVTSDCEFEAEDLYKYYYRRVHMMKPYRCHRRYR